MPVSVAGPAQTADAPVYVAPVRQDLPHNVVANIADALAPNDRVMLGAVSRRERDVLADNRFWELHVARASPAGCALPSPPEQARAR